MGDIGEPQRIWEVEPEPLHRQTEQPAEQPPVETPVEEPVEVPA